MEPVVNQASAEPPPPPVTTQPPADAPVTLSNLGGSLPGTTTTPPAPQPSTTTPPKEPAPPTTQSTVGSSQFLVGKKTGVPGRVLSPYPPYQELDVTGLASGSLALDPTTDKVFEIP